MVRTVVDKQLVFYHIKRFFICWNLFLRNLFARIDINVRIARYSKRPLCYTDEIFRSVEIQLKYKAIMHLFYNCTEITMQGFCQPSNGKFPDQGKLTWYSEEDLKYYTKTKKYWKTRTKLSVGIQLIKNNRFTSIIQR